MHLPRRIQLEPVGQCNLRCQMCPIPFRQDGPPHGPPAFMAFDLYCRLLEQFEGVEQLHLQGLGEPMMHPRLFEMARCAADRGIVVSLNTNLTLLNPARAEACVTCGFDTIHVSIDGATAATYERIRVRGRFDRLLRNLHLLQETRARLRPESTPRVRMVVVVMRQNAAELADLVRLAHRFGIESIFVQHLCHDFGESSLPAAYLPMRQFVASQSLIDATADGREAGPSIAGCFDEAREVSQLLGIDLRLPRLSAVPHPPGTPGPERCDWPWTGAYVSYQGLAMPCCMVATPDRIHFGSMADHGVESVWNGAPYQAFRTQLASDDPPEVCRSCSVYHRTF